MFNPEKLLGGLLLGGSRRRSGIGSLVSSGAALGLVGVAMEAVEHFMEKSKTPASMPPPLGQAPIQSSSPVVPPPSPGTATSPPPPPGSATSPAELPTKTPAIPPLPGTGGQAVLMIRAMIAAANADGVIDETERNRILKKLEAVNLSDEEHSFIVKELLSPVGLDQIAAQVDSMDIAKDVYTVSLLAIDIDTDAEKTYMRTLAQRLGLNESTLDEIHAELGIERFYHMIQGG
jgi:uncharacterized membrane protein YebE (DUF533 family)